MAITARIDVKEMDLLGALRGFFEDILNFEDIKAILVPQHLPMKNTVMPTLVTDPEHLKGIDPLAPAFPMNTAKIVSRLTRKRMGAKVAAVVRPCEIRAFFELVKLKQGRIEEVVFISMDCLGAYQNKGYARFVERHGNDATLKFYQNVLCGNGGKINDVDLTPACQACEYPLASNADIHIGLHGVQVSEYLLVQSQTEVGDDLIDQLAYPQISEPATRSAAIAELVAERTAYRDEMLARTCEFTDSLEKLSVYLADCVNCYNCRVACPVCYCKECVFFTDVFNHDPSQYLRWANRKGSIKMPTDTVFFHITRLAHMSTACVGCGQCSNACPNDIPIMELFRTVAHRTQQSFAYEAGRSLDERPPMSVFREEEFSEVVGISS